MSVSTIKKLFTTNKTRFSVYLCIFIVFFSMLYAIMSPYMKLNTFGYNIDYYLEKVCNGSICEKNDNQWKKNGESLLALYIIFIIITTFCCILYLINKKTEYNWFSFILLGFAISIIITLTIILTTSTMLVGDTNSRYTNSNFQITPASILVLVVCSVVLLQHLVLNDITRTYIAKLYHKIF